MFLAIIEEIIELAIELEGRSEGVIEWMTHQPIVVLGGLTALELTHAGEGAAVIEFLRRAISDEKAAKPRKDHDLCALWPSLDRSGEQGVHLLAAGTRLPLPIDRRTCGEP